MTLRAYAREEGDGTVLVEVTDTGSGIPSDDLPRVFDRFWRAEKSRSRRTGGSDLGLAIVRKLVEAHGGTVDATSVEGEGRRSSFGCPERRRPAPDGMTTAF